MPARDEDTHEIKNSIAWGSEVREVSAASGGDNGCQFQVTMRNGHLYDVRIDPVDDLA